MSQALRRDLQIIADWIRPGSRVLDLGCGEGELLSYLQKEKQVQGYGIEVDDERVAAALRRGVSVIQQDLDAGLRQFASGSVDAVVLSLTLQAVYYPRDLLLEMLRVGREGIVSFPNFGYWKNRLNILLGNMPVSRELPYQWYDTPNVHLCTLDDFETFCRDHRVAVLDRRVMTGGNEVRVLPNLLGSTAVYRFQRGI